jgi:branched-chain amino acid transport system ATP-binding protein
MLLLRVDALNIYYGSIHSLKDVSLEVHEGEIVTLIGANGAGKSTLLRGVSGLVRVTSGSIIFMGKEIHRLAAYAVARLGIAHVPEGRAVFPGLTVFENLRMGAYAKRSRSNNFKEEVETALSLVPRLRERIDQVAGTLSGGEQQMLAISRGLISSPKIMLLDEPSLGLSPILVDQVFETIKQVNALGTTILLVEQNAFHALEVSHRGYVLETGRIVLRDTCANLRRDQRVRQAYLGEE